MLLKYFSSPIFARHLHKYVYKMETAYFRQLNEPDKFHFTFEYFYGNPSRSRAFNLNRNISETLESFLTRVTANVTKYLESRNKKKKDKNVAPPEITLTASILTNNAKIPETTICKNVFLPDKDLVLQLDDKRYKIIVNSPWVDNFTLPSSILANFPVYPSKFETVFTIRNLSEYVWFKSKDKNKWEEVSKDYIYTPKNEDIGFYLKLSCTPKNEIASGPTAEALSPFTVQASPGFCPFENRHAFTKEWLKGKEFRVMTYNLLADLYADSDFSRQELFPYCPSYALEVDYRKQLFLKEIIGYHSDLICLQEVDRKIFSHDLEPTLSYLGYQGHLTLKGGEVAEGLAFFYNMRRFNLLNTEDFIFSKNIDKLPIFADIWAKIASNEKLAERILNRTTTLQVNTVESTETQEIVVAANTHLYFHPDSDHIRLLHGCLAIRYLENFVENIKHQHPNRRVSLIFCGDFNSVPSCGIFKLYTEGFVPGNFVDYSSNQDEKIENIDMTQKFKLQSACGTPKYTNFTVGFADCLDYIYIEKTNLEVTQVVPLPSVEELQQNRAIPSVVFPSDHIALVSDLKWI